MFIAHLPANYVAACTIDSYKDQTFLGQYRVWAFRLFVLAGIAPDLDMLYFYLLDNRGTHHHLYWPHIPFIWAVIYAGILITSGLYHSRKWLIYSTAFFLGIMLHLFLDTPMGGIAWAYPFSDKLYYWTEVPAQYSWWVWNFILHWTFISELVICVLAVIMFWKRSLKSRNRHNLQTAVKKHVSDAE